MVPGRTLGVEAAHIAAGINALLLAADLVAVALRVYVALWLAVGGLADESRKAGALFTNAADNAALCVRTTWRRRAELFWRGRLGDPDTAEEWVSGEAGRACADRLVLDHLAGGMLSW